MQLQQDTLFANRYFLKKLLGRGGFSEVWLVEDTKVANKKMALKVYAPGMGLDDDGVQLFSREFELVFDLNQTNLLRPSHFDVCDRSPYLVMPYCESGSATKLVGKITEEEAWRFLHDVAAGLAYLHKPKSPIIHQDIKPDNVLIDHNGHYLITDFGISTKARSTLRQSVGNVKSGGTIAYMSPERFGKDNTPIKAGDVWALGATLYELLNGDVPFGDHGGLIQKSGAEIPTISGNWSDELKEIINRCLHVESWNRPTAIQLVEWAEKHSAGKKINFEGRKENDKKPVKSKEKLSNSPKIPIKKIVWGIVGFVCIGGLILLLGTIPDMDQEQDTLAIYDDPVETAAESDIDGLNPIPVVENTETLMPIPIPTTTSQDTTWKIEYNQYIDRAQSAFNRKKYEDAQKEYDKALALVRKNGDTSGKESIVRERITACEREINRIQAQKREEEAKQKAREERLQAYEFVGIHPLGTSYFVVQKKTDTKWGIIDRDGNVKVAFNYDQVSNRLKNGYYALGKKEKKTWDIFDISSAKIASELNNLDNYK